MIMEFDLDYAKKVILGEAEGIKSVVSVVDESFAKAAEMIYNCNGSVIVSGIGKAGIIGRKISATLLRPERRAIFCIRLRPFTAIWAGCEKRIYWWC